VHLKSLSLLNFKNYEEADLSFTNEVNCFVGNNGEGKTNLLDAVHYLSFCKSYFNPIDSQNIRFEQDYFMVQGTFEKAEKEEAVYCGMKRGQKKQVKRNKKEYSRLADHIGLFPVVMISPNDSELITEGSEVRRKFVDSIISQYDRTYLDNLIQYNKALTQRNALLKQFYEGRYFDADSLDVWDMQLVALGQRIHEGRKAFLNDFIPLFQEYFEFITKGKETVGLSYRSQLNDGDFDALLKEAIGKDRGAKHSTVGIHKDDLLLEISGHPLKKFGSQGQQKSFLIALKLAQFDCIKRVKEMVPILLLDDIFDKLDHTRVKRLMELVSDRKFGQIFITDTSSERVPDLFTDIPIEFKLFTIKNGAL
jgi:DNA replication and repair protein RecF